LPENVDVLTTFPPKTLKDLVTAQIQTLQALDAEQRNPGAIMDQTTSTALIVLVFAVRARRSLSLHLCAVFHGR